MGPHNSDDPDRLISTAEAARLIGVTPERLLDLVKQGRIVPAKKNAPRTAGAGGYHFKLRDVEEYAIQRAVGRGDPHTTQYEARAIVERSRKEQGLPERVEDPSAVRRVVEVLTIGEAFDL